MIELEHISRSFGGDRRRVRAALRQRAGKARIRDVLGANVALDDVSISVREGELFVIMGLSGSGKSTLIRLINGLIAPDSGTVRVDGQDISTLSPTDLARFRRARIAMVFQSFALFPHLSVRDNAAYGLAVAGMEKGARRDEAERWLARVGLEGYGDAPPRELSGGMRQRVGLARALATGAPILLMDEPFSALDPLTRGELQDLLLNLEEDLGRTIVFVTHDLAEAARLASRIAVLQEGSLAQLAAPAQLILNPANSHVAEFVAGIDRARALKAGQIADAGPIADDRLPQVGAATPLGEVAVRMLESPGPRAVVDRQNKVIGVVTPEHVAGVLNAAPRG